MRRHPLAGRLGGLPLALHLAGSYINDDLTAIRTFTAYRHELDVRFRALMSAADVEGIEARRRRAVTTTWEISLDDLKGRGLPHARELLQTMSSYAPATPIPGALLDIDTASSGTHGKQEPAGDLSTSALRGLRSVGLIDVRAGGSAADDKGVVVHPLVAETTFLSMSIEQREQRGRTAAELIRSATSDLETQRPEHWPQWRIVSPHLLAIIGRRVVERGALGSLMETACRGIWALCESGDYGAAEDLARECIGAAGPLGPDHPIVLTVRHELGGVLRERGQPAAAEAEYREVLEARAGLLGADHPATFGTLRQMSGALWDLDRLAEAEAGYRTVLAQQIEVNGADDPDTIRTRHDLAGVLASQARFVEAQGEYESALAAGLRVLGPEHPSVLATCHQLAGVLRSRHLLDEAELTCRAVLDRRTTAFGPDHVATISSQHRLGRILQDQDRTAEAEAVYRDALDRCLRSVGVRHPLTRDVQNDLDMLLQNSTQHPE
jgi:tetratricopeptide (TPR) repeat protein